MRKMTILWTVMVLSLAVASSAAAVHAAPLELTFEKDVVASGPALVNWQGTFSGEDSGRVAVGLTGLTVDGLIWKVTFDWAVDGAMYNFNAQVSGVINTKTGDIVLNGVVTSGDLEGSRVKVRAEVVNEALSTAGIITVTP